MDESKPVQAERKKLMEEKTILKVRLGEVKAILEANKKLNEEKNQTYNTLFEEIKNLKAVNKSLNHQRVEVNNEFSRKLYEFEKQQEYIEYVKMFKKKQNELRKKQKEEESNKPKEVVTVVKNYFVKEIEACQFLEGYYGSFLEEKEEATSLSIGLNHVSKSKKKTKAPKVSKRLAAEATHIIADSAVLESLKSLGIDSVPTDKTQMHELVKVLQAKREEYEKRAGNETMTIGESTTVPKTKETIETRDEKVTEARDEQVTENITEQVTRVSAVSATENESEDAAIEQLNLDDA